MTRIKPGAASSGMPRRASVSFPLEYEQIFMHVINTKQDVIVNNLGNKSGPYTQLRHSMNEWRSALSKEGSPRAPMLYTVVVKLPEVDAEGKPFLRISLRDGGFGAALASLTAGLATGLPPTPQETIAAGSQAVLPSGPDRPLPPIPAKGDSGAAAISGLFGEGSDNADE